MLPVAYIFPVASLTVAKIPGDQEEIPLYLAFIELVESTLYRQ